MSETNAILIEPEHKLAGNSQQTAKRAAEIVKKADPRFVVPDADERKALRMAFAARNYVLYGKALDIVKIEDGEPFSLKVVDEIERNRDRLTIYEIKSTGKEGVNEKFERYFFSISTAELLTAQDLKAKYRFLFVNTKTGEKMELTLKEVLSRAKGFYPAWSIQF